MKTIIKSILFTAVLALVITGCQTETDDLSVTLKSSTTGGGGYYKSNWFPGGGASAECALAGGCDAGSYKMDHGIASGITYIEDAVTVVGLSDKSFTWTSTKPVCKIIVKAGTGAYIFELGGVTSGTMTYPVIAGVKAKGISHITFCYSEPLVIAVKVRFTDGTFGVSPGNLINTAGWCGDFKIGYMPYIAPSTFKLYRAGSWEEDGRVEIYANGDVEVFANEGLTIDFTYVFVGPLGALQTMNLDADGCPIYSNVPPWLYNGVDGTSQLFDIP